MSAMRKLVVVLLCVTTWLASLPAHAAVAIDNVRVYRAPEYTRFVFDVSEPAQYQVLPDAAPGRVIIDVRNAALKAKLETVDLQDSPVRRVRSGLQADGTTRIVLDLAVDVRVSSFALQPNELYGHRLVVDLYDKVPEADPDAVDAPATAAAAVATTATSPGTVPATTAGATVAAPVAAAPTVPAAAPVVPPAVTPVVIVAPSAAPAAPATTATPPAVAAAPAASPAPATTAPGTSPATLPAPLSSPAASLPARPVPAVPVTPPRPPAAKPAPAVSLLAARSVVVAIDAGHGGDDPGARGPAGTREKDVVLAIARAVRERMRDEPGMKPVLIRDGDYYVGLKDRRTRARKKYDADLFVSIHADAFTRREARGASVFAVSRRGATSTMAAYLASSENRADLVGGIDPRTDNDLISVISDMMMEGTMRESLQLGRGVLDELGGFARLHKRGVEQAGFMVLKEPNMPSILIETGFISNPEEERLLADPAYQQRLARAVVNGVRRYFENSPPPGTWFAAHREGRTGALARVDAAAVDDSAAGATDSAADPLMLAAAGKLSANGAPDMAAPSAQTAVRADPVGKARSSAGKATNAFVRHKVGRGQSLGWLAQKYGVSQREIKQANNLKRDDIRIGETLKIPQP